MAESIQNQSSENVPYYDCHFWCGKLITDGTSVIFIKALVSILTYVYFFLFIICDLTYISNIMCWFLPSRNYFLWSRSGRSCRSCRASRTSQSWRSRRTQRFLHVFLFITIFWSYMNWQLVFIKCKFFYIELFTQFVKDKRTYLLLFYDKR